MHRRSDRWKTAVTCILAGLVIGAVIIAILGKNPFSAYYNLLQGCGLAPKGKYASGRGMITDLLDFIDSSTPMIFGALAVAVAMKGGLFNIGVSGQMLAAGFVSSVVVGYSSLSAPIAKPLVLLIGIVVGAMMGALVGFLKFKFNINEVVSTIMLNYIVSYVVSFLINTKYVDPVSRQSKNISASARLTLQNVEIAGYKCNIPLGFIIALLGAALVAFVLDRTVLGFELKAVGTARTAAKYDGIRVGKSLVATMAISGALAGMAGVTYYVGYFASIQPKVLPSIGYDAIAVSLVGNNSPLGIVLATLFLQIISKGSTYMSSRAGLESEIASVITAVILLSTTISSVYMNFFAKRRNKMTVKSTDVSGKGGEKA